MFAYLDHNVLDLMTKGDPDKVGHLLKEVALTPVFTDENLAEIGRCTGYEQTFLNLLQRINARHLVPLLDSNHRYTGNAEIRDVSPLDAYSGHISNRPSLPDLGFGLSGMLQKMYGGRKDQSFGEIFSGGVDELGELLKKLENEIETLPGIDEQTRVAMAQAVALAPRLLRDQYAAAAAQLDLAQDAMVKQFGDATGIGPKILNNIRQPDVLGQIWKLIQPKLSAPQLDMESFFGIKPLPFEKHDRRERTKLEKVNAIYHQLNFIGYYRDSNMGKPRRFTASISDMTHAGLASFCHVLICRDRNLVMKAAAAYEYVGVATKIAYFRPECEDEPQQSAP